MAEKDKQSFIKLSRTTRKHWLWKSSRVKTKFEAWIDLLMRANFESNKEPFGFDLIEVQRGQILTSQDKLSQEWNWNRNSVRKYLDLLQKDSMIVLETTQKYTMITLCNYSTYNDKEPTAHQQDTNSAPTARQQSITYKNVKNDKNVKNEENSIEARPKTKNDCIDFLTTELNIDDFSAAGFSESFFDYYESNGWKVGGRAAMKNWKAALRGWVKRDEKFKQNGNSKNTRSGKNAGEEILVDRLRAKAGLG